MASKVQELRDEVARLQKTVKVLIDRAERDASAQVSEFGLFQTTLVLGEEVDRRVEELGRVDQELRREIAERKLAQAALLENETKFRGLFENANDAILLFRETTIIDCNAKTLEMFGCGRDEMVGQQPHDFWPPLQRDGRDSREKAREMVALVLAGRPQFFEWAQRRHDGTCFDSEVSLSAVELGDERLIQAITRDVSERKKAEGKIKQQAEFLQLLIDTMPYPVFYKDEKARYLGCNRAFEQFYGTARGQIAGKTVYQIAPQELADIYHRADSELLAHPGTQVYETSVRSSDGIPHDVIFHKATFRGSDGAVAGIVGAILDITERKKAEEERARLERRLEQSQKLESLGVLAGGIAHDFNNILTAILGNAELALGDEFLPEASRRSLLEITKASRRAAALCREMLAYAGGGTFMVDLVDLSALVKDLLEVLRTTVSKKAVLNVDLATDLPALRGDSGQLSQAVMNLVINASEALGEQGGTITVSTGAAECSVEDFRGTTGHECPEPGLYLILEVTDTGSGMDEEAKRRLFEPFFSTKFTGRGLGLSAVLGIVHAHRGAIVLHSEPGQGTVFRVFLPAVPRGSPA